jgi:hypothetical protein
VTFRDWLRKTQPLLAPEVLPEHMALVRDGMELAWDAALESALAHIPRDDYPRAHSNIASLRCEQLNGKGDSR